MVCIYHSLMRRKKCLKGRQKLGTRENLKKIENLKKFENLKFKIAQVDPRDMLNNFSFHVEAQKSLFIAENCNGFFFDSSTSSTTLSSDIRVHRAGSQLKINWMINIGPTYSRNGYIGLVPSIN
jgi:hypothetical protein